MIKPFGIVLILYIIKNIVLKKTFHLKTVFLYLLSLSVFFELFINVGYFIKVGDFEVLYSEVMLLLLFLTSVMILLSRINSLKIKVSLFFFTFSLIATELYLIINPIDQFIYRNGVYTVPEFSMYSLMITFRVVMMLIISVAAINVIDVEDIKDVANRVIKNSFMIYILCVIEWIIKNLFKSDIYNRVVDFIFGKGEYSISVLLERGSRFSLQGLLREPAHLSFGLFIFLLIVIFSELESKNKLGYLAVGLVLLVASGSLSGIGYAAALVLIYIIYSNIKIKSIIIISIILLMIFVLIPNELTTYYALRLKNSWYAINSSYEVQLYTSEHVRLFSIIETYKTVITKRPLLGAGLGMPYAYSASIMIVGSIGILGFLFWFWYYFISIGNIIQNKRFLIVIIMFLVLTFIGSISIIYSPYILLLVLQMRISRVK